MVYRYPLLLVISFAVCMAFVDSGRTRNVSLQPVLCFIDIFWRGVVAHLVQDASKEVSSIWRSVFSETLEESVVVYLNVSGAITSLCWRAVIYLLPPNSSFYIYFCTLSFFSLFPSIIYFLRFEHVRSKVTECAVSYTLHICLRNRFSYRVLLLAWLTLQLVPVLNELSIIWWRHMKDWRNSSTIVDIALNIGEWSASRLYPRENIRRYQFDERLDGPQTRPRRCVVEKNILYLPVIEPRPCSL
jgi:hypothetical protein